MSARGLTVILFCRPLHWESWGNPQHVVQHNHHREEAVLSDSVCERVVGQWHSAYLDHGAETGLCSAISILSLWETVLLFTALETISLDKTPLKACWMISRRSPQYTANYSAGTDVNCMQMTAAVRLPKKFSCSFKKTADLISLYVDQLYEQINSWRACKHAKVHVSYLCVHDVNVASFS